MTQSHRGRRKRIAAIWIILAALLSVPGQTPAAPGLTILESGPHYSGATYRETVRDLRVKVLGGHADLTREWRDERWWFHPYWTDLRFNYNSNNSDGQPDAITRYDLVYKRIAGPAVPTYAYRERLTINRTDTGWRWANRDGDWIDYDADGHSLAFGDRNATRITLRRNLGGFIDGVLDANGHEVLRLELDEIGRPQRAVDHSGRAVQYNWTGDDLASVRDGRAQLWRYDYATLDETRLLAGRTDPRGYHTVFTHQVSPGGRQCLAGDGLRWAYDDASDTWGRKVDRCTRWVTTSATLSLREISDALGSRYRYAYFYDATKKHYIMSRRDGEGTLRERRVDLDGELIEERLNGRLITETRKDGRHRIRIDARGLETRIERDQWDNPIKLTHPDGSTVAMAYDPHHNGLHRRIDERGVITEHQYDEDGNRIQTIEAKDRPEERITRYSYDANGLLRSRTVEGETEDATAAYTYDAFGNLESITSPEGDVHQFRNHDAMGNPRALIDARGMIRRFTYDAAGNRLTSTSPLGHTAHDSYDANGNRASHTDALGHTTTSTHDARNRLTAIVHPDGSQSTRGYNGRDQLLSLTDEAGHLQLSLAYDAEGNLATHTDGAGNRTSFDHGSNADSPFPGLLNRIDYPTYNETFGYDLRGRRTLEQLILGADTEHRRRFDYDPAGNLITDWDEVGRTTEYTYDGLGQLIGHTDTAGQQTDFGYDTRGNLTAVTNARGIVIRRYDYDDNDRQIAEILPDGNRIEIHYDVAGNLIERTDADGRITRHHYDQDGRLTRTEHYPDQAALQTGTPEKGIDFSYDANDRLIAYQDGISGATYAYDNRGRLTAVTVDFGPFSKAVAYTYDTNGLQQTYTDAQGITYTYHYDDANRLARVELPDEGSLTVNAYRWTEPTAVTLPGGVLQRTGHDPLLRIETLDSTTPAGERLLEHALDRDPIGNITAIETEHGHYAFTYDAADRLTGADRPGGADEAFTYDPVGNRLSDAATGESQWQYDERDRLLEAGPTQYAYDDSGARTEKTKGSATQRLVYDSEGRLAEVQQADGTLIAAYAYDPMGRRIQKTVGSDTRYFLYTGEGLAGEYDSSGNLIAAYGYSPDSAYGTEPLWQYRNGVYGYYHRSHLGTPLLLTDKTDAVLWQARYAAFGEATISGVVENPLRFPGQYYDQETGLHYNWFRDYDPSTGRYVQSDPIGLAGGLNAYAYVDSNPLVYSDPTGEAIPAAIAWAYLRCYASCVAWLAAEQILLPGSCLTAEAVAVDCALECLKPINWVKPKGANAANSGRTRVIGRTRDLDTPGVIRPNESLLDFHVVRRADGSTYPKPTWKNNSSALRRAMREGRPIRDASRQSDTRGPYLNAERNLLRNRGWTYDAGSSSWIPPTN